MRRRRRRRAGRAGCGKRAGRFRELFARLPAQAPDGDTAIAQVWGMAQEERERRRPVLASLPPAVRAAMQQLPREQAAAIVQQLRAAGIIG